MNNVIEAFGELKLGTVVIWLSAIFFLIGIAWNHIHKLTNWYDSKKADREVLDHYREDISKLYQTLKESNASNNNRFNEVMNSINHICNAQIETLNDRIREKCHYYVSLGYIPEDELEDFQRIMKTYQDIGGNHGLELKYQKTMELPIKVRE